MEQPAVYVGIDVGKAQLEVALRPSGEQFSLANDERAAHALFKHLAPLKCARIVIEATGGYETLVVAALHAGGLPVVLANPRWVLCVRQRHRAAGQDRSHRCTRPGPLCRARRAQIARIAR